MALANSKIIHGPVSSIHICADLLSSNESSLLCVVDSTRTTSRSLSCNTLKQIPLQHYSSDIPEAKCYSSDTFIRWNPIECTGTSVEKEMRTPYSGYPLNVSKTAQDLIDQYLAQDSAATPSRPPLIQKKTKIIKVHPNCGPEDKDYCVSRNTIDPRNVCSKKSLKKSDARKSCRTGAEDQRKSSVTLLNPGSIPHTPNSLASKPHRPSHGHSKPRPLSCHKHNWASQSKTTVSSNKRYSEHNTNYQSAHRALSEALTSKLLQLINSEAQQVLSKDNNCGCFCEYPAPTTGLRKPTITNISSSHRLKKVPLTCPLPAMSPDSKEEGQSDPRLEPDISIGKSESTFACCKNKKEPQRAESLVTKGYIAGAETGKARTPTGRDAYKATTQSRALAPTSADTSGPGTQESFGQSSQREPQSYQNKIPEPQNSLNTCSFSPKNTAADIHSREVETPDVQIPHAQSRTLVHKEELSEKYINQPIVPLDTYSTCSKKETPDRCNSLTMPKTKCPGGWNVKSPDKRASRHKYINKSPPPQATSSKCSRNKTPERKSSCNHCYIKPPKCPGGCTLNTTDKKACYQKHIDQSPLPQGSIPKCSRNRTPEGKNSCCHCYIKPPKCPGGCKLKTANKKALYQKYIDRPLSQPASSKKQPREYNDTTLTSSKPTRNSTPERQNSYTFYKIKPPKQPGEYKVNTPDKEASCEKYNQSHLPQATNSRSCINRTPERQNSCTHCNIKSPKYSEEYDINTPDKDTSFPIIIYLSPTPQATSSKSSRSETPEQRNSYHTIKPLKWPGGCRVPDTPVSHTQSKQVMMCRTPSGKSNNQSPLSLDEGSKASSEGMTKPHKCIGGCKDCNVKTPANEIPEPLSTNLFCKRTLSEKYINESILPPTIYRESYINKPPEPLNCCTQSKTKSTTSKDPATKSKAKTSDMKIPEVPFKIEEPICKTPSEKRNNQSPHSEALGRECPENKTKERPNPLTQSRAKLTSSIHHAAEWCKDKSADLNIVLERLRVVARARSRSETHVKSGNQSQTECCKDKKTCEAKYLPAQFLSKCKDETPTCPEVCLDKTPERISKCKDETPTCPGGCLDQTPERISKCKDETPTCPGGCLDQTPERISKCNDETPTCPGGCLDQTPERISKCKDETPTSPGGCLDQTPERISKCKDETPTCPGGCLDQTPERISKCKDETPTCPGVCLDKMPEGRGSSHKESFEHKVESPNVPLGYPSQTKLEPMTSKKSITAPDYLQTNKELSPKFTYLECRKGPCLDPAVCKSQQPQEAKLEPKYSPTVFGSSAPITKGPCPGPAVCKGSKQRNKTPEPKYSPTVFGSSAPITKGPCPGPAVCKGSKQRNKTPEPKYSPTVFGSSAPITKGPCPGPAVCKGSKQRNKTPEPKYSPTEFGSRAPITIGPCPGRAVCKGSKQRNKTQEPKYSPTEFGSKAPITIGPCPGPAVCKGSKQRNKTPEPKYSPTEFGSRAPITIGPCPGPAVCKGLKQRNKTPEPKYSPTEFGSSAPITKGPCPGPAICKRQQSQERKPDQKCSPTEFRSRAPITKSVCPKPDKLKTETPPSRGVCTPKSPDHITSRRHFGASPITSNTSTDQTQNTSDLRITAKQESFPDPGTCADIKSSSTSITITLSSRRPVKNSPCSNSDINIKQIRFRSIATEPDMSESSLSSIVRAYIDYKRKQDSMTIKRSIGTEPKRSGLSDIKKSKCRGLLCSTGSARSKRSVGSGPKSGNSLTAHPTTHEIIDRSYINVSKSFSGIPPSSYTCGSHAPSKELEHIGTRTSKSSGWLKSDTRTRLTPFHSEPVTVTTVSMGCECKYSRSKNCLVMFEQSKSGSVERRSEEKGCSCKLGKSSINASKGDTVLKISRTDKNEYECDIKLSSSCSCSKLRPKVSTRSMCSGPEKSPGDAPNVFSVNKVKSEPSGFSFCIYPPDSIGKEPTGHRVQQPIRTYRNSMENEHNMQTESIEYADSNEGFLTKCWPFSACLKPRNKATRDAYSAKGGKGAHTGVSSKTQGSQPRTNTSQNQATRFGSCNKLEENKYVRICETLDQICRPQVSKSTSMDSCENPLCPFQDSSTHIRRTTSVQCCASSCVGSIKTRRSPCCQFEDSQTSINQTTPMAICPNPSCPNILEAKRRQTMSIITCPNPNCPNVSATNRKQNMSVKSCPNPCCPHRNSQTNENLTSMSIKKCPNSFCPFQQSDSLKNSHTTSMKSCPKPSCPHQDTELNENYAMSDTKSCPNSDCPFENVGSKNEKKSSKNACDHPCCPFKGSVTESNQKPEKICDHPCCPYRESQLNKNNAMSDQMSCPNPCCPFKSSVNESNLKPKKICDHPCPFRESQLNKNNAMSDQMSCPNPCCPFKSSVTESNEKPKKICDHPCCPFRESQLNKNNAMSDQMSCPNPCCPFKSSVTESNQKPKKICDHPCCPFEAKHVVSVVLNTNQTSSDKPNYRNHSSPFKKTVTMNSARPHYPFQGSQFNTNDMGTQNNPSSCCCVKFSHIENGTQLSDQSTLSQNCCHPHPDCQSKSSHFIKTYPIYSYTEIRPGQKNLDKCTSPCRRIEVVLKCNGGSSGSARMQDSLPVMRTTLNTLKKNSGNVDGTVPNKLPARNFSEPCVPDSNASMHHDCCCRQNLQQGKLKSTTDETDSKTEQQRKPRRCPHTSLNARDTTENGNSSAEKSMSTPNREMPMMRSMSQPSQNCRCPANLKPKSGSKQTYRQSTSGLSLKVHTPTYCMYCGQRSRAASSLSQVDNSVRLKGQTSTPLCQPEQDNNEIPLREQRSMPLSCPNEEATIDTSDEAKQTPDEGIEKPPCDLSQIKSQSSSQIRNRGVQFCLIPRCSSDTDTYTETDTVPDAVTDSVPCPNTNAVPDTVATKAIDTGTNTKPCTINVIVSDTRIQQQEATATNRKNAQQTDRKKRCKKRKPIPTQTGAPRGRKLAPSPGVVKPPKKCKRRTRSAQTKAMTLPCGNICKKVKYASNASDLSTSPSSSVCSVAEKVLKPKAVPSATKPSNLKAAAPSAKGTPTPSAVSSKSRITVWKPAKPALSISGIPCGDICKRKLSSSSAFSSAVSSNSDTRQAETAQPPFCNVCCQTRSCGTVDKAIKDISDQEARAAKEAEASLRPCICPPDKTPCIGDQVVRAKSAKEREVTPVPVAPTRPRTPVKLMNPNNYKGNTEGVISQEQYEINKKKKKKAKLITTDVRIPVCEASGLTQDKDNEKKKEKYQFIDCAIVKPKLKKGQTVTCFCPPPPPPPPPPDSNKNFLFNLGDFCGLCKSIAAPKTAPATIPATGTEPQSAIGAGPCPCANYAAAPANGRCSGYRATGGEENKQGIKVQIKKKRRSAARPLFPQP